MAHEQPAELVIAVYLEANNPSKGAAIKAEIKTLPERPIVEHPGQTVYWIGLGGEISNVEFEASNGGVPGPPPIKDRKRMHKAKLPATAPSSPAGKREHKYGLTFHPDGGGKVEVDPLIIIEY